MMARASPNIALIKYWGKKETVGYENRNLALNSSISMTLSQAVSTANVKRANENKISINGERASEADEVKILNHLNFLGEVFGMQTAWEIESQNNFPAGAGIASSASAYAALTLATVGELLGMGEAEKLLRLQPEKLSAWARMGSGSAARSIEGGYTKWDDRFARKLPLDWKLRDTIVIFSSAHKAVPSSMGHTAALKSPLFTKRLKGLPERMRKVEEALLAKDLFRLGPLIEEEALEMHGIVESSNPPIRYRTDATNAFLNYLQTKKRDYFFTLDAGPNVHILSERDIRGELDTIFTELGLTAEIWPDWTGTGPMLISPA